MLSIAWMILTRISSSQAGTIQAGSSRYRRVGQRAATPGGRITGEILRAQRDRRLPLIYTTPFVIEIIDVLGRDYFRTKCQIQPESVTVLINLFRLRGELVISGRAVKVCRNPKDEKFLDAALAGKAEAIVSRDDDLLVLNPFEGITILRPSEFLARI